MGGVKVEGLNSDKTGKDRKNSYILKIVKIYNNIPPKYLIVFIYVYRTDGRNRHSESFDETF